MFIRTKLGISPLTIVKMNCVVVIGYSAFQSFWDVFVLHERNGYLE